MGKKKTNKKMLNELKRIDSMYTTLHQKLMDMEKQYGIDIHDSPANELQDLWCEIHQFRDDFPDFNYAKMFYED